MSNITSRNANQFEDRGQGCGQGIRDAALLIASVKSQKNEDLKRAFPKIISEYEEEVIKRGKEEVEMSVQAMILAHDWEKLMASPIVKLAGRKISDARIE